MCRKLAQLVCCVVEPSDSDVSIVAGENSIIIFPADYYHSARLFLVIVLKDLRDSLKTKWSIVCWVAD